MKNLVNYLRLGAIAVIFATLASCVTGPTYNLPKPIANRTSEIPTDARAVAAVIEERLRGKTTSDVKGVVLPDALGEGVTEKDFAYGGFSVTTNELLRYAQRPGKDDGRVIAGKLEFEDAIGRRAEVLYYADYVFENGGLRITDIQAAAIFSTFPEALMFVVPVRAVASAGGLPKTHSGMVNFVAANAVDWRRPELIPSKMDEYIIFAFLMDRVSPSAEVELKISEEHFSNLGYKNSSKYIDINGWRIGVLPGKFNLANSEWFIKVTYTPGEEIGGARYTQLIGSFPLDLKKAGELYAKAGS